MYVLPIHITNALLANGIIYDKEIANEGLGLE